MAIKRMIKTVLAAALCASALYGCAPQKVEPKMDTPKEEIDFSKYAFHDTIGGNKVDTYRDVSRGAPFFINSLEEQRPNHVTIRYIDSEKNDLKLETFEIEKPKDYKPKTDLFENESVSDSTDLEILTYSIFVPREQEIVESAQARFDSLLNIIKQRKEEAISSTINKKISDAREILK